MDIKREILTACQLLVLLYLLFWSFTWNLPADFDFNEPRKYLQSFSESNLKESAQLDAKALLSNGDKHSIIIDSFESISKSEKQLPSLAYSLLPPFNIWKEVELTKQEIKEVQDKIPTKAKPSRRKLNYSSSKCGAKILAANKEAKYRTAILNEKIDEYMLNPCKAKSWFIIELCDNIEATQIEIANYELYSSTPKEFSVFWSDVYPTQTWHLLGTFEAKDERTVQTFELNTRNMGKFMKVAVLNHHGKEHYCPLSVFRILGYSMVYEYEDIELEREKSKSEANDTDNAAKEKTEKSLNSVSGNSTQQEQITEGLNKNNRKSTSNLIPIRMCKLNQKYCAFSKSKRHKRACPNKPSCLFLKIISSNKKGAYVSNNICRRNTFTKTNDHFSTDQDSLIGKENSRFSLPSKTVNNNTGTEVNKANNTSRFVLSNLFREKEHLAFLYSLNKFHSRGPMKSKPVEEESLQKVEDYTPDKSDSKALLTEFNVDMQTMNHKHKLLQENENIHQNPDRSDSKDRCSCAKDEKVLIQAKYSPDNLESLPVGALDQEKSAESAALIQKESVLVKLTSRMKASETNLNLINRYLQKLSQSYRHQMDDMQNMFNVTLNAIRLASEEANKIDEQQKLAIEQLEHQVKALNDETQYLSQAQGNTLKKVLELHGFFLILEFIIMSTIFSIFVNRFRLNKH